MFEFFSFKLYDSRNATQFFQIFLACTLNALLQNIFQLKWKIKKKHNEYIRSDQECLNDNRWKKKWFVGNCAVWNEFQAIICHRFGIRIFFSLHLAFQFLFITDWHYVRSINQSGIIEPNWERFNISIRGVKMLWYMQLFIYSALPNIRVRCEKYSLLWCVCWNKWQ